MNVSQPELKRDPEGIERLSPIGDAEFKFLGEGDAAGTVEGYASIFGDLDGGNDIVVRGAFRKSLIARKNQKGNWRIPMFMGHAHAGVPVGVWDTIEEDSKGLRVKGRIIRENEQARQLHAVLLAGGDMGMSIGYKTIDRAYRTQDGKEHCDWKPAAVRLLKEVDLYEISFTGIPMLESARVTGVKSLSDEDEAKAAHEAQAKALVNALEGANQSFLLAAHIDSARRKLLA